MRIIKNRERIEEVTYSLSFEYVDIPGAGFGFPCDENGKVEYVKLSPEAKGNYMACLLGKVGDRLIKAKGIAEYRNTYTEPAIGICTCGNHVKLEGFTNTCEKCGKDYNWGGQELAPRECWGEETGETAADILQVNNYYFEEGDEYGL